MIQLLTSRASRKTAEMNWNTAVQIRNYYRPISLEQYVAVQSKTMLEIEGHWWILKEPAEYSLRTLVSIIYDDPALKALVSKATVRESIYAELKQELRTRSKNNKNKRTFLEVLAQIECSLFEQIDDFEFFFPVEGVRLKDISRIDGGLVELFVCDSNIFSQLASEYLGKRTFQNSDSYDRRYAAFEENFLNRVLIKTIASGEFKVAQKVTAQA